MRLFLSLFRLVSLRAASLCLAALGPVTAAHSDDQLNGMWSGAYDYGDQIGPQAVWFSVVFEGQGDEVKGRSLEVQTFGSEPSIGLSANLKGLSSGGVISLIKQYDGSGGQQHAVHLRLTYDANGNLVGEWMVDPQTKGRVELFKLAFRPAADEENWLDDEDWED